ncbi:MAG: hypothetical protein GEV13_27305 [Rhodospirillales bacterium]|nr:hypothetical protein [Rhodospirillales bacterium]
MAFNPTVDLTPELQQLFTHGPGMWHPLVEKALKQPGSNYRDLDWLTSVVFYLNHLERRKPDGYFRPIDPGTEPAFVAEYYDWRKKISSLISFIKVPTATAAIAQFPHIPVSGQYGPRKIPDGFYWGVQFQLGAPATNDGYIIQEISQTFVGTTSGGAPANVSKPRYWEAWQIKRGAVGTDYASKITVAASIGRTPPAGASYLHTPVDDIFFDKRLPGETGTVIYVASAAFYELPLPSTFVTNNPSTGASNLPSTTSRPAFWRDLGLCRVLRFEFNLTAGAGSSTLGTFQVPVGSVAHASPNWPRDFTMHP